MLMQVEIMIIRGIRNKTMSRINNLTVDTWNKNSQKPISQITNEIKRV